MSDMNKLLEIEDDLDYELDVEMEDGLLESDEETCEVEADLVKQMSMTSVTSLYDPSPASIYSSTKNDLWLKSVSTIAKLNENPTRPANDAVEPTDAKNELAELKKVQDEVEEVQRPLEPQQAILERKEEMGFEQMKQEIERKKIERMDKTKPAARKPRTLITFNGNSGASGSMESNHTIASSSSSTSSSSKRSNWNRKRIRHRKPQHLRTNGFQNSSEQRIHRPVGFQPKIEPLMGIRLRHDVLSPSVPARKASPFIIQAQSDGDYASRTVLANPALDGFSSQNIQTENSSQQCILKRELSTAASKIEDLRTAVLNKRRLITKTILCDEQNEVELPKRTTSKIRNVFRTLRKTINCEEKKVAQLPKRTPTIRNVVSNPSVPEPNASEKMVCDDEDRNYLLEIEKQKMKREEILREKEIQREKEFQRERQEHILRQRHW